MCEPVPREETRVEDACVQENRAENCGRHLKVWGSTATRPCQRCRWNNPHGGHYAATTISRQFTKLKTIHAMKQVTNSCGVDAVKRPAVLRGKNLWAVLFPLGEMDAWGVSVVRCRFYWGCSACCCRCTSFLDITRRGKEFHRDARSMLCSRRKGMLDLHQ